MNNRRGNLVKAEVPKEGLLPLIFIIIPLFIGSLGNKLTQYAGVDKLSKKIQHYYQKPHQSESQNT